MDAWITQFLQSWADYFSHEPNAKQSLQFLTAVMSELKELSKSKSTKTITTNGVARSILALTKSQQNPEEALIDLQALIIEAAGSSSPLSIIDLAEVTRSLIDNLPDPLSEKFELQLASSTRERWNGPDKPSSSKGVHQCIEEWVSLNTFIAYLTYTMPLQDYALRKFHRAFGSDIDLDERGYHIPAAAAWIDILGEDIYLWSSHSSGDDHNYPSGFDMHEWHEWKRGFETCLNSGDLSLQAKGQAGMAFCKMKTLETSGTYH